MDSLLPRRALLGFGALLLAAPGRARVRPRFAADPFTLGVASGDPDHRSAVLWTRLAPDPLTPDGGMGTDPVAVRWEVAEDERFAKIVQKGSVDAVSALGHSVHVTVDGLAPDRWYWYRFHAGEATSPVGRTRTFPAVGASSQRLRFAFASCQHFEQGLYTAYDAMAADDPDFVAFLGDYIYEGAGKPGLVRRHHGGELQTLTDYRIRYAQHRTDPLLQRMHARCPWIVTPDDHEVENDYAGAVSERKGTDPAAFLRRRAAAYQAYYEAMPLRASALPHGPDMRLYRRLSFGNLAEILVLDTRQYRTDQPNDDKASDLNAAALDPKNSLLGAEQRRWLEASLVRSPGVWNVLAQQVMMGMLDRAVGPKRAYSMDQWPGAARERMELVRFLQRRRIANPVVLTGDIHSHWANDLRVDDRRPESPVVATEWVGTSISSGGDGVDRPAGLDTLLSENPGVRFHSSQRGYVRCTVTPTEWRSDFVVLDRVSAPGGTATVRASFVTRAGRPGIQEG